MNTDLKIIELLAKGIDPVTGEVLPQESPYNSPEVIRALFAAIDYIKHPRRKEPKIKKTIEEKQADNVENNLPKNAGLVWTEKQKSELANQFKADQTIASLAGVHERTKGAIVAELKKQGLIEEWARV